MKKFILTMAFLLFTTQLFAIETGDITSQGTMDVATITISTGNDFYIGTTRWNSGDSIDGEQVAADTIDDDSIDLVDVTLLDFLNDRGFITGTGFVRFTGSTSDLNMGAYNVTATTVYGTTRMDTPQIAFPASQSASTDPNTMDDYEEGTWTPLIKFGGNNVSALYSAATGEYTKVGQMAYVSGRCVFSSKGTSTGDATLEGFPFTAKNVVIAPAAGLFHYNTTFANVMEAYVVKNSTKANIHEVTEAGTLTSLTEGDFADNSVIHTTLSYIVQ